NMKKYAIHLISGATINKLMIYIFFELLIVMSISLISVFIYMRTIGLISYTYYVPMIIVVPIIILMGMIPLYMKLKKLNISEMLKRRV
ncbi:ABC transporter permease, partial [Peribacillus butanolivorans]